MTSAIVSPDSMNTLPALWSPQDAGDPKQEAPQSTPYDSVWAHQGVPEQQPTTVEAVLLKEDKLYTVLAVVLIIWFGIMAFMIRTDRKLDKLEQSERSA